MTGRGHHVDLEPGQLEALAAPHRFVGLVALEWPEPRPGHVAHDVSQHRNLELGAPHGRARGASHRRHRADVIEVGVSDQDRLDAQP